MIIGYDRNPNIPIERKLQSLMESVQMALNETVTNIKTINNTSLLGSGNISISGGAIGDDYVVAQSEQAETSVGTGTWRVREWNSGKVEIWYYGSITLTTKSALTGLYRNARKVNFPNSYTFGKCSCVMNGTAGGAWLSCGGLFNASDVHAEPYTKFEVMAYQINTYPANSQTDVSIYICGEKNS